MKITPEPCPSPCYGIDIAADGAVVLAERHNYKAVAASRYAPGEAGVSALRAHIGRQTARPRICILSSGAAALTVAMALAGLPGGEIMLVAPIAIQPSTRAGRDSAPATPEERAQQLARLAGHLY